ncbi:carbohydrate ABC transporter permease [bacterium]|nr:carbohydrate ABC transporter permease [bacterium]
MQEAIKYRSSESWRVKLKRKAIIKEIVLQCLLIFLGITFLLPFLWMISTSLKSNEQIFKFPPVWIPNPVMWSNYSKALQYFPFFRFLGNTLYITTFNVIAAILAPSFVAYGFSRIKWPGRDILFLILLSTMMIPSQVTMIPVFVMFKKMGWVGTFKPLIVPAFFGGGAFSIFLMRQFFMTIPQELVDAAKVDGCSHLYIYWRIMMPLSKPAIATLGVFAFIGSWRDFLGPLIYLQDERQYTLAIGLRYFLTQYGAEWAYLMAASAVVSLPMVVAFFLAQKTFIQGITFTGIKG